MRLQARQVEAPSYMIRATADEIKRGQSSEQIDAFYREAYPSYAYWSEAHARDGQWEADCLRLIRDFEAEHPVDDRTPLQRKELSALMQDLASAQRRKALASEMMQGAA